MIPYINDIGLSADEIDRVEELHKRFAFVVYNAGFSCTMEEGRKVEMCYWQNLRGVRQSALFPGHAAAWRDALRTHEEAVDAVKANPGVHRVARMPGASLDKLKKSLEALGYSFGPLSWSYKGMRIAGYVSQGDAVRDAVQHWEALPHSGEVKSPSEVQEGQRRAAKRVHGVPEGSKAERKLRILEGMGYEFYFASSFGWACSPIVEARGKLTDVVEAAWKRAVEEGKVSKVV